MRIEIILLVFHRILDFNTGWISILALFFCLPLRHNAVDSTEIFLTKKGDNVAVRATGEGEYLLINSFKPNSILLDMNVSSQNGRVMCQRIKSQAQYKHIPVVFLSADQETVKLFQNYRANASLEKPFE
jgi:DNA-binding response OmpR family regulator